MQRVFNCLSICLLIVLWGCGPSQPQEPVLTSINIINHEGFSETISNPDRLKQYENVDFLCQQPYQKVLRAYSRDQNGDLRAYITSYHPNGATKQYLEVVNNRAFGAYREWFDNGVLKLDVNIIGGVADIDTSAEKSWIFDGCSNVWNEQGNLIAQIPYTNGKLEGVSLYYHPNGAIWKKSPFHQNLAEGVFEVYLENGFLLQTTEYANGEKNGIAKRFWEGCRIASEERYCQGLLDSGSYYDVNGVLVASVKDGSGYRPLFSKDGVSELDEYHNGRLEGEVKVFDNGGVLVRLYHMQDNLKHGEEIEYYDPLEVSGELQPKLSVMWAEGKIQGLVKTWYPNGIQESQREISNNVKTGLLTAWYPSGSVMLIEQYDHDKLVKGDYFTQGDKIPVSEVKAGRGTATIFDAKGNLLRKVQYNNGKPLPE